MNKCTYLLLPSITALPMYSMDQEVVPKASYVVFEGEAKLGGVSPFSRWAIFYSSTGVALETVAHHGDFEAMKHRLDRTAPKPQPVSCEIEYCPALGFGRREGDPGHLILFYDKNGNTVDRYRYDTATHVINDCSTGHERIFRYMAPDMTADDLRVLSEFPLDVSQVVMKR